MNKTSAALAAVLIVVMLAATLAPVVQAAYGPVPRTVDQMWATVRGLETEVQVLRSELALVRGREAQDRQTISRIAAALQRIGIPIR